MKLSEQLLNGLLINGFHNDLLSVCKVGTFEEHMLFTVIRLILFPIKNLELFRYEKKTLYVFISQLKNKT